MGTLHLSVRDACFAVSAVDLRWRLQRIVGAARMLCGEGRTQKSGSTSLLSGGSFGNDVYDLHLYLGDYFENLGWQLPRPYFLDEVNFRFTVQDSSKQHFLQVEITPHSHHFGMICRGD